MIDGERRKHFSLEYSLVWKENLDCGNQAWTN